MNQILESTYFKDRSKWEQIAINEGGLEVCDDETGYPLYTIGAQLY
ncbi:hypothetical protein [Lactobacillus johnsonii]|mgnify:FL=1|jgi:hypothetical protein|nr:hypothetical protein [Lactobacillus johnsonii]